MALLLAIIFFYFLLVAAVVLLLVFPSVRTRAMSSAAFLADFRSAVVSRGKRCTDIVMQLRLNFSVGWACFRGFVSTHPRLALLAPSLLIVPVVIAWSFGGKAMFDFSGQTMTVDRQIALLLEGEGLVPPPQLPPEIFTTGEVEMFRPDAVGASRDWQLMDSAFVQRLLLVFKLMKERHGYEMALIEGYRSPERQNQLFAQGGHVTRAAANMSYHQYGLAADAAFLRNGQIVISERDPWAMRGYALYGEISEELGLTWGGRWKMLDYGHVELRRPGVLRPSAG